MSIKILLVEDDPSVGALIEAVFTGNGSALTWYKSGKETIANFYAGAFDICIIDYSLPDMNGVELSQHIRNTDPSLPFLFVTGNHELSVKYLAFEEGCDDYILKPFQIRDLVLRVEAIMRRSRKSTQPQGPEIPEDFMFDYNTRTIQGSGKTVKLSSKESHIFSVLLSNFNTIVERKTIMLDVWGNTDNYTSKCLDVYLSKLRKLIKMNTSLEILNEHGVGYKLIKSRNVEEYA
jgi:DNA-binding response OmpR family regulator